MPAAGPEKEGPAIDGATMSSMAWFTAGVTVAEAVGDAEVDIVVVIEVETVEDVVAETVVVGVGVFGTHEVEPGREFSNKGHEVQAAVMPVPSCENELAGHWEQKTVVPVPSSE